MEKRKDAWPNWFINPEHAVERHVLLLTLNNNERLNEIYFVIQMMPINYLIFKKNYDELIALLDKFNNPMIFRELALETNKGHEIASDVTFEFTRLLHNFLASAKMLIDVTRSWSEKLFQDLEFMSVYQTEINKRFANNVQARFLQDLRNFTLHRTLPIALPELRFHQTGEHELRSSLGIVLVKQYLLEWKEWSELGRMQLEMETQDKVDIRPIIEIYVQMVTEFTQWLAWEMRDLFSDEVDQINSAIKNIRNKP